MVPATIEKGTDTSKPKSNEPSAQAPLSLNMIKDSMMSKPKPASDSGSSNGGNQSDNSALVGFANFGFDFDSAEGNSSPPNSEQNDNSSDSDGGQPLDQKQKTFMRNKAASVVSADPSSGSERDQTTGSSSGHGNSTRSDGGANVRSLTEHHTAAANASANLQSIAEACAAKHRDDERNASSRKRKAEADDDDDDESNRGNDGKGYESDSSSEEGSKNPSKISSGEGGKKKLTVKKREERNAREKERSFRISKQINELRDLLSTGGVIVAKGTKSSVLTEAANYIRMLQQHQYRSELDRHQLIQQMQLIGSGAQGPQAATAIRHVAAQNGVWSLGNFGGVPPRTASSIYGNTSNSDIASAASSQEDAGGAAASKVEPHDYRFIFDSCGVGMAIASMGGALIDCNQLFCDLSGYTKQELCSLTIFNLTARQNLREAFDLISQMISPPLNSSEPLKTIVLRGAMKDRVDLGIAMSLVKGEDGVAKCFCVTLVKNPSSPFDTSGPVPVSFEALTSPSTTDKEQQALNTQPTFTSG